MIYFICWFFFPINCLLCKKYWEMCSRSCCHSSENVWCESSRSSVLLHFKDSMWSHNEQCPSAHLALLSWAVLTPLSLSCSWMPTFPPQNAPTIKHADLKIWNKITWLKQQIFHLTTVHPTKGCSCRIRECGYTQKKVNYSSWQNNWKVLDLSIQKIKCVKMLSWVGHRWPDQEHYTICAGSFCSQR